MHINNNPNYKYNGYINEHKQSSFTKEEDEEEKEIE